MSSKEEMELQGSIKKMKKVCKVIQVGCFIALLAFILVWLLIAYFLVADIIKGIVGLGEAVHLILFGAFVCSFLIIALRAFSDIVKGESPFSQKQVKRLRVLGTILLICTILETAVPFLPIASVYGGEVLGKSVGVVTTSNADPPIVKLNAPMLIMSAMCYGFAIIFKYGVLLQQLSDDTV